ncbi:MAG: hypothetical protein ACREJ6_03125 [Candidatus Methylomirabilis sp.]
MIEQTASKSTPLALTLLRIIAGFLFMPHGAQKLFSAKLLAAAQSWRVGGLVLLCLSVFRGGRGRAVHS